MDRSNGYETIAPLFINSRGKGKTGIGVSTVQAWARAIQPASSILDLGCGTGFPVTKALLDAGHLLHAVDASPSMVAAFQQNFPDIPVACEAVEDSPFFHRSYDAIIAWGLVFLLPSEAQMNLIPKMAASLNPGGRLLFTAPPVVCEWRDAMTDQWSRSLGALKYKELITSSGLSLLEEFEDEGKNHYYHAQKTR